MHAYAQTNVQLFEQLRAMGYSKQAREDVRVAYVFAMRLFTSLYLPSGKTFISHLVGTASILASLRVPVEIAIAALLHAAYRHGIFNTVERGISESKREQVRRVVGQKVEQYIACYHRVLLTPSEIATLDITVDQLGSVERYVVVMRLANELEHLLDLGALYHYHTEKEQRNIQSYMRNRRDQLTRLAERLGFPSLGAELRKRGDIITAVEIPLEPNNRHDRAGVFLITPASYREQSHVLWWRKLAQFLRMVWPS